MRPLTVTIYDEIGIPNMFGEAVSSKSVLQALGPSTGAGEILVRMNSPGGDVTEGLAIHNLLLEQRRAGVQVTCRVDGMCASIATVIACAATTIEMAENAFWCVHFPMNGGNLQGARSEDLRERADLLDSMTKMIVPVYVAKTGMSEDEVRALMESDKLISAQEALKLGFIDRVIPANLKAVASIKVERLPEFMRSQVPSALKQAKAKMEELDALKAAFSELKEMCTKMAEDVAALKGGKAKAEEDKPDESGDTNEDGDTGDEPTAQARLVQTVLALTGEKDLAKAEGKLMAQHARTAGAAATAHADNVSKAIANKKLLPSLKSWALKNAEAFNAYLTSMGDSTVGPVGEHQPDPTKAAELAEASSKKPTEVTVTPDELALARMFAGKEDPLAYAKKIKAS